MSARTDIRDGIVSRLRAVTGSGQALDGYTVDSSRVDPIDDPDLSLPAPRVVLVWADDVSGETLTRGAYGAAFASRDTVRVQIEAWCSAATGSTGDQLGTALELAVDAAEAGILETLLGDQAWLDSLADHPIVAVSTGVLRMPSGRYRGVVSVTLDCPAPAREVL